MTEEYAAAQERSTAARVFVLKAASTIFPDLPLVLRSGYFECPHCLRTWERGGHKEEFVKVAARTHVLGCWKVGLYLRGFVYLTTSLVRVDDKSIDKRCLRSIKALVKNRTATGEILRLAT